MVKDDHVVAPFHFKWCRVWRLGKPFSLSKHELPKSERRCDDMANHLTMSPQARAMTGTTWDHTYTSHRNMSHLQIDQRELATTWPTPWPCRRTSTFGPKEEDSRPTRTLSYKNMQRREKSTHTHRESFHSKQERIERRENTTILLFFIHTKGREK